MIVNLIDNAWQSAVTSSDPVINDPRPHFARIIVYGHDQLGTVVRHVIRAAEGHRSIWLLRIFAHGNHGLVQLGDGYLQASSCDYFRPLRPYFTPNGLGVALHSCGPASHTSICRNPEWYEGLWTDSTDCVTIPGSLVPGGGSGVDFMKRLSREVAVPVRGGVNPQYANWQYRGVSIAVSPTGRMVAVPDLGALAFDTTRVI